jgi:hypothetical protein
MVVVLVQCMVPLLIFFLKTEVAWPKIIGGNITA